MAVNQGLSSLANATPDFSNQGVENAINDIITNMGAQTISYNLDRAIETNSVLTDSQKNDIKDSINVRPHINVGRTLGDLRRHTANILNGSLVFRANPDAEEAATFLEQLGTVSSFQTLIPILYGVSAEAQNRGVDDHFGTLGGILSKTDDSSEPLLTQMKRNVVWLNGQTLSLQTAWGTAQTNLLNFINSVVADSTDFQQTLDTFVGAVNTAAINFDGTLQAAAYTVRRNSMVFVEEEIDKQIQKESANLYNLRSYSQSVTDTMSYLGYADQPKMANIIIKASQNKNWQDYFMNYPERFRKLNPIYTGDDATKDSIIQQVQLATGSIVDVVDHVDLDAVVSKAEKDDRIDTAGWEIKTNAQKIENACQQLGIRTNDRSVYNLSDDLLKNLKQHDIDVIKSRFDDNSVTNKLS
tara:strand:+ start:3301 stop:4539 length:1239 start_codon:yes stop_codon:yes gene_type:complete